MNKPYTYLVGWPDQNFYYYGVRYRKGCCRTDFFTTYFTSSKLVHECMIRYGLPPVQQIRKEFAYPKQAMVWEQKVLRRIKVLYNNKWLNKNISGAIEFDENIRQLMSDAKKGKIWVHKNGKKTMIRKELLSVFIENGYARGHGQKYCGVLNGMWGRTHNQESKQKISMSKKGVSTISANGIKEKSFFMKNNNPMSDPETKKLHKEKMQELKVASKPVFYNTIKYSSVREANSHFPLIKYSTLAWKCANKKDGWSYDEPS